MNKKQLALIALFLFILGSSLALFNLSHYIDNPGNNTKSATIIIPHGSSVKKIGKDLAKHNIISYPKVFYLIHKIIFSNIPLHAGEYTFHAHSSMHNIIRIMNKGMVTVRRLTFPEGTTHKQIIDTIDSNKALVGETLNEFKEGDFLADTYHYTYGENRMTLLNRIYHKSQITINRLWENRSPDLPFSSKKEAITLASIVEKETAIASERKRIAGVFINRLRKDMRLQADPTVIYAVTQGQYTLARKLKKKDLRMDSPYNTYLYKGLPPSAISSPGKSALEAVLNPPNTKELYFVANRKGGHNFSSSLKEHNKHVKKYRNAK
jgi:UPF0755 protein